MQLFQPESRDALDTIVGPGELTDDGGGSIRVVTKISREKDGRRTSFGGIHLTYV